ncbi:MAG: radical SAM family heme chaperone HemW [Acidimicrobiia bacterium]|nr:radical SAM family heme chaperone HemW [Acidimicrobiia bacterium]
MSDRSVAVDEAAGERAAYIHIPFCHRRCPYCDFAVVDLEEEPAVVDRYVDALATEIALEPEWAPLHAINLGGGTPSVLAAGQIERVLEALSARFGIAPGAEVSIEANPEDWTRSHAASLRRLGVNRVSLGVQSFDGDVLRSLGRNHDPRMAVAAVENSSSAGYENVNVDLIFGTPGESVASWCETVATAVQLDARHLSAYALTVERGTALSRAIRAGSPAPDEDDLADKYEELVDMLPSRLIHYEVSNWAEAGSECRYNLTTWAQGEYLGFGLGAHGHRDGVRRRNVRRLDVYLSSIEEKRRPEAGREQLDPWARDKERVFLGLRRRDGVRAGRAGAALWDSEAGRRFARAGVVDLVAGRLVVLEPLLTDAVAREVLALAEPQAG